MMITRISTAPNAKHPIYNWLFVIIVLLIVIGLTAAFWQYTQDDVFITYVYSRNIAHGVGFVFNPYEQVQGTTTPLYALLMAGIYAFSTDLLHIGNTLSALFLLLSIWCVYHLLRPYTVWLTRAAAVLLIVTSPLVYVSFGMETLLYSCLLMLSLWWWERRQPVAAILTAAALTWTRSDGVVLAGALLLSALLDNLAQRRRWLAALPWKLGTLYILAILPWYAFAWWYFGTPLPNTFGAKQEFLRGIQFLKDMGLWWQSFYGQNPLTLFLLPLGIIGIIQTLQRPPLRPLAIWTVAYLLGYTALNVTAFWYYTPLLMAYILLACVGAEQVITRWITASQRRLVGGLAVLAILIMSSVSITQALPFGQPPQRVQTYTQLGTWLRLHTPPNARVVVGDLGIVGYYAERHMIDFFGLIVPDMHIKQPEYAVIKYKPDYVVATQYFFWQRFSQAAWFRELYAPLVQYAVPQDSFSPMLVYQRRFSTETAIQQALGLATALTCSVEIPNGAPLPPTTSYIIRDSSGKVVQQGVQPFFAAQYPTSTAQGAEHVLEQIVIPVTLPVGDYTWSAECGANSTGTLRVMPSDSLPDYHRLEQPMTEFASLQAVALPAGHEAWAGGSLPVLLTWSAQAAADDNYSVFVHVIDQQGQVVAQADGYPRQVDHLEQPTSTWQPKQIINDLRQIDLPSDVAAGTYQVRIGWYNWQTGQRLMLANGQDALTLPLALVVRWAGGSGRP